MLVVFDHPHAASGAFTRVVVGLGRSQRQVPPIGAARRGDVRGQDQLAHAELNLLPGEWPEVDADRFPVSSEPFALDQPLEDLLVIDPDVQLPRSIGVDTGLEGEHWVVAQGDFPSQGDAADFIARAGS